MSTKFRYKNPLLLDIGLLPSVCPVLGMGNVIPR